ncbi:flagellar assembly protein FliX [Pseudemcibacter aquimaris]|uniref:flagellar assembly protein FliX n=1 Tax=Pseudemcibacter aquimaris TaxID=2857064 RepID=UPI002013A6BF|nr:flagellar assembly protein FliX [Pseudemcibacter aquimaris]MCC3860808.1 flagellar assembly protein FliX [Pseudemcibacter aquimaris]WDU59628.1 flagellar assembly protein FliX [Pseudemcibacter aquimaris]
MKIKGPGRVTTGRVEKTKGKSKADGVAFEKALGSTEEVQEAGSMSGTAPITSVNSLLSLQEMPSSTDGRAKTIERAEGLLDHLEAIRHGLLLGTIPRERLTRIVSALGKQREKNLDPALVQIINDIELRAKVELAKLEYQG